METSLGELKGCIYNEQLHHPSHSPWWWRQRQSPKCQKFVSYWHGWSHMMTSLCSHVIYKGVSKSFQTGCLKGELQMVQLSATRCSCITILWVSLVSFATITLCVTSQQVFVVYFVIDSAQKLLDTLSYVSNIPLFHQHFLSFCNRTVSLYWHEFQQP
jgi:hypothetical protein